MNLFFKKEKKVEYYRNIDELPIFNWFKIQRENNFKYLLKEQGPSYDIEVAVIIWEDLFRQYINEFGLSDEYKMIVKLQNEIIELQNEMLQHKKRSNITFIKIKEAELSALKNQTFSDKKIDNGKVHIEKFMGFKIDEKTTTVKEYFSYIYTMKNAIVKDVKPD